MHKAILSFVSLAGLALPVVSPAKVLRVVADENYPPYIFVAPNGQPSGYIVDEWELWEQKTGIKVELTATNWSEAQSRMRRGQADVIDMIFETPERESSYDFSPPFATVDVGIYTDRNVAGITGPSGLRGFVVGVERGDACAERLAQEGIHTVRFYTNYNQIIAAANTGEIHIFCMDGYPAAYYLYRSGTHGAFVKAFDFYKAEFRRGVHKGDKATLELVERGMALITPAEQAQLHQKWMGQPVELTGYAKYLELATALFVLAGGGLSAWVYALRRAVRRRTRDLEYLTHYDPVTRLPNRQLLLDRIRHAMAQGTTALAVLVVDLDNFKLINDSFGHSIADALLRDVARQLEALPFPVDTVASLGGDNFVIVIRTTDVPQVTAIIDRVRREIAQVHVLDGQAVYVNASVGASQFPDDGDNGTTLVMKAEAAMFRAKQNGRNGISFYSATLSERANHYITIGSSIRRALENEEFELLYQPQYCLTTQRVVGVEALVRWRRGAELVPPSEFIAYAEELGLIDALGGWVLTSACMQLGNWLTEGAPAIRVAVNLSALQLNLPGLLTSVVAAIAAARIPAHLLELEITETALVSPEPEVTAILASLRAKGVGIAMDDFGTGYSSLASLRHLPVNVVKIDKSFLAGTPEEEGAAEVVAAIVAMAHALKLTVVAEGVEDQSQADFLQRIGCDIAQGWLYGRPMSAGEVMDLLRR